MYLTTGIGVGGIEAIERCSTNTVRKCLPEGSKPIGIIGDPDSQRPGKWSSTSKTTTPAQTELSTRSARVQLRCLTQ